MKQRGNFKYLVLTGILSLAFASLLWAQRGPDKKLEVNGRTMDSPVIQIGGRSYVDVETLAQVTNGVVAVQPDKVVLTIPPNGPRASQPSSPPPDALSREFAREAIGLLAEMREWRGAIGTTRSYNVPFAGTWPQDYHDRIEADLQRVSVAAMTPGDQQSLQLLGNEFDNLSNWANNVIAERQSLNATKTVDPDVTQNDQDLKKLSACSNFLGGMLVSGTFLDDLSCH
jgi:hypothetical protein